jgi:transcriptional regulator with PAS, ATPase and Fis domain
MPRKFLILVPRRRSDPAFEKKLLTQLGQFGEVTRTGDWGSMFNYASILEYEAIFISCSAYADEAHLWQRDIKRLHPHQVIILYTRNGYFKVSLLKETKPIFAIFNAAADTPVLQTLMAHLDGYLKFRDGLKGKISRRLLRPNGFGEFIGNSQIMLDVYRQMTRVAGSDYTVLIQGESGSGKELVARTTHQLSARNEKPFVSINCAAIPENLLESELFGYEKGAFTGANQKKMGKFELAHGGTLFLDEIGDMPLGLQVKLLRVIEDRKIQPLGSIKETDIDVRLMTATHRDLDRQIALGDFREDLHYRLNVIPLHLPPLRERGSDLDLLTFNFLEKLLRGEDQPIEQINWSLISSLKEKSFKGNVRELENLLTRSVLASDGPILDDQSLPHEASLAAVPTPDIVRDGDPDLQPLWQVEKEHLEKALLELDGNISQVSQVLEISRTAIYRKIKKYNLTVNVEPESSEDESDHA